MAFLLSNTKSFSSLPSPSQDHTSSTRRGFHTVLGEREKALLADDPALKNFKSYKPTVRRIGKIGDVITFAVFAACCYEIYQHGMLRMSGYGKDHQA